MKLIQLKIFKDIATHKSFVKAAHDNFLSQPSISLYLKQLEEELGVKLIDRAPRKVALTPLGEQYLGKVNEIIRLCEELSANKYTPNEVLRGEIKIASIHSIGMYELDNVFQYFMKTYPRVRINLQYHDSFKIYNMIQKQEAHVGLVAYPSRHTGVKHKVYKKSELCLAVYPSHRFANRTYIDVKELMGESFVLFDAKIPTRRKIDAFLREAGVSVDVKMTNNNIYAIKKAITAELGISIVPRPTVKDELAAGTIKTVSLKGDTIERPLAYLLSKDNELTKVTQAFVDVFEVLHR